MCVCRTGKRADGVYGTWAGGGELCEGNIIYVLACIRASGWGGLDCVMVRSSRFSVA